MKLHLGCGTRRVGLDDFFHIDIRSEVKPDFIADITNLDGQFLPEGADMIYWCHGLEHIPRPLVEPTLKKLYSLLRPSGVLRLSLPDFEIMTKLYLLGDVPLREIIGPIMGRQDYPENTHFGIYDSETLYALLTQVGFVNVHSYDPRIVWPQGFDDYSLAMMGGRFISINAEAARP